MVNFLKSVSVFLSLGFGQVLSQEALLAEPVQVWRQEIVPSVDGRDAGVMKDNGCKLTPDGKHLVVTSSGGTVTSFDALSGELEWEYNPPQGDATSISSASQVVFTTSGASTPYMVYSYISSTLTLQEESHVVSLDMDGNELWISDVVPGAANGSPVISDNGDFVFFIHNGDTLLEKKAVGYFTGLSANEEGAIAFSRMNETTPFSPLGIFHNPIKGNYDDENGFGNTNDFMMWSMTPKPSDASIQPGALFGFQFPVGFAGNASESDYLLLGEQERNFQINTAPVITNRGLFAYITASRSNFYAWNGQEDNRRGSFNRGPQGVASFERRPGSGEPVYASVALSSSEEEPFVFGGTSAAQFMRMNFDYTEQSERQDLESFVQAEARVDPLDRVVYFVEDTGILHQVDFNTISDVWTLNLEADVTGEMAISDNGYFLYVADEDGFVTAFQVSEIDETVAPSAGPTDSPSYSPSASPSTSAPTPEESAAPSMAPVDATDSPTVSPSAAPVFAPETDPTAAPVVPTVPPSAAAGPAFAVTLLALIASFLW